MVPVVPWRNLRLRALIQEGAVTPPLKNGDALPKLPEIRLPKGTVARLLDEDGADS